MRNLLGLVGLAWAFPLAAQAPPEVARALAELERIERLVEAGGLAAKHLSEARQMLADAQDQATLRRTLFGPLQVDELSEELEQEMRTAAQRLVERQQARIDHQRKLVEQGVAARTSLTPLLEELDLRRRWLIEAEARSRLWNQLAEMARAEQARLAQLEAEHMEALKRAEGDPNYGTIGAARLKRLEQEFERMFGRPLPVSARGDTLFHRTLGYNHTGRVDVALNPDSPEGRWLCEWLEVTRVPYMAFRSAIRGVSSAPHIHIGPPSARLRLTD
ncbi:MAG: hypothetical protein NZV14_14990 [Bryobacteraceae bacterium]|nr:hypothetical protein [Bryobacteraceae bacterium]MDW8379468.1 hypothetical protein [Bryobacterales bacterium]